jgi:uncharacterized protein YndB with AHSA1/START domain
MTDRIERELLLPASPEQVWEVVTGSGWLAEEVDLDLRPGGDARFVSDDQLRSGWVEHAAAPERLAFWWGEGDEPATRVELSIDPVGDGSLLRIVETRPLEHIDAIGTPMPGSGAASSGPVLVAG